METVTMFSPQASSIPPEAWVAFEGVAGAAMKPPVQDGPVAIGNLGSPHVRDSPAACRGFHYLEAVLSYSSNRSVLFSTITAQS